MKKLGWANEANEEADKNRRVLMIIGTVYILVIIIFIIKIINYLMKDKKEINKTNQKRIKYYRDIPREKDATPAEAAYLYNFYKERISTGTIQRNAVSATLLDLCLKKIISLKVKYGGIYVKILQDNPENLKKDELAIYNLLKIVGKDKEEFEIGDLNRFANKEYYKYSKYINQMVNSARNSLYKLKLIDKSNERRYKSYKSAGIKFSIVLNLYEWLILTFVISILPMFQMKMIQGFGINYKETVLYFLVILFPLIFSMLYSWKLQERILGRIAVLTQLGSDEKAKWKGLANYMQDFSLLDEKELPQLAIWEKYLVYATAFGIADKVLKQLKVKYPEVMIEEQWGDEKIIERYPLIYFSFNSSNMSNPINRISSDINTAYHTSITQIAAHSSSSGSGGGGGFSGGGGGRRRRWPEWDGR